MNFFFLFVYLCVSVRCVHMGTWRRKGMSSSDRMSLMKYMPLPPLQMDGVRLGEPARDLQFGNHCWINRPHTCHGLKAETHTHTQIHKHSHTHSLSLRIHWHADNWLSHLKHISNDFQLQRMSLSDYATAKYPTGTTKKIRNSSYAALNDPCSSSLLKRKYFTPFNCENSM